MALVGLGVVAQRFRGQQQTAVWISHKAARCVVSVCDLEGHVQVNGDGELCDCVVHDVTSGTPIGISANGSKGKGTLTLRRMVIERCFCAGVYAYCKAVVTVMDAPKAMVGLFCR